MFGALMLIISTSAQAVPMSYNFKYEFGTGEVLSGTLNGELQDDLDTVLVTDVLMVTFTGLPGTTFQTDLLSNVVSLSGAAHSFSTIAPDAGLAGFSLPVSSFFGPYAIVGIPEDYFYLGEFYIPERWSLTHTVVEPATFTLFGLGLAGLGLARRKKA
tara:strand:+ start:417 stop:890 length:474 start_codon:yes stop_codon:yes gene_type:complete